MHPSTVEADVALHGAVGEVVLGLWSTGASEGLASVGDSTEFDVELDLGSWLRAVVAGSFQT